MAKYEFTKKLETGNTIIDKEHRELLDAVNNLMDACSKGQGRASMEPTIKFLVNYVHQHFTHEEQLQRQSRYPGYTAHKAFHDQYKRTLQEITAKIPPTGPTVAELGALNRHIGILISHIRTEDKKLGQHLKNS